MSIMLRFVRPRRRWARLNVVSARTFCARVFAALLAGCGSTDRMVVSSIPQDDYQVRHPIVLGEEPRRLEILVEPATGQFDRRFRGTAA